MSDPGTDPGYLEEAAAELRKARRSNEARAGDVRSWLTLSDVPVLTEINNRRMEIADGFIRLAAIKAGMDPEDTP